MGKLTIEQVLPHVPTGISASSFHIVGIKKDGSVVATKNKANSSNYVTWEMLEVDDWEDIVAVSAGDGFTIGLKKNGTVLGVGDNDYGEIEVGDWEDIVMVSAGSSHTVGLKSNGTVVATPIFLPDLSDHPDVDPEDFNADRGQTEVDDWEDIVMISAGDYHTVGLKKDGTVVATPIDDEYDYGQTEVDDWEDIVMISAGRFHTVGLKNDGTVLAVGDDYTWKTEVDDWEDIVAVSAGETHTLGLKKDGTVVGIGGDPVYAYEWPELLSWNSIIAVSAGLDCSIGLKADGTVVVAHYCIDDEHETGMDDWTEIVNHHLQVI